MSFDEYGKPGIIWCVVGKHPDTSLVTHFSMWALVKSPLIMGHDLLNMVRFVK